MTGDDDMSNESTAVREREKDPSFERGDAVIRRRLEELASSRGLGGVRVARRSALPGEPALAAYEYYLVGTERAISLRAREVRLASEPETMRRYLEPRLEAVFEDIWWRKSVVLMRAESRDETPARNGLRASPASS